MLRIHFNAADDVKTVEKVAAGQHALGWKSNCCCNGSHSQFYSIKSPLTKQFLDTRTRRAPFSGQMYRWLQRPVALVVLYASGCVEPDLDMWNETSRIRSSELDQQNQTACLFWFSCSAPVVQAL